MKATSGNASLRLPRRRMTTLATTRQSMALDLLLPRAALTLAYLWQVPRLLMTMLVL